MSLLGCSVSLVNRTHTDTKPLTAHKARLAQRDRAIRALLREGFSVRQIAAVAPLIAEASPSTIARALHRED